MRASTGEMAVAAFECLHNISSLGAGSPTANGPATAGREQEMPQGWEQGCLTGKERENEENLKSNHCPFKGYIS